MIKRLDGSRCHLVLGREVGLFPGHIVLNGTQLPLSNGAQPPIFGPCLLWPNGCPSQLLLSTCLLVFYCNYVIILHPFGDITVLQRSKMPFTFRSPFGIEIAFKITATYTPSDAYVMPPGNQRFWVLGEVWLQASWKVEDRESSAALCICGECVVPSYYTANTVLPSLLIL